MYWGSSQKRKNGAYEQNKSRRTEYREGLKWKALVAYGQATSARAFPKGTNEAFDGAGGPMIGHRAKHLCDVMSCTKLSDALKSKSRSLVRAQMARETE